MVFLQPAGGNPLVRDLKFQRNWIPGHWAMIEGDLRSYRIREVAQPGSALRSGRRGRRFESCLPDHFSPCFWKPAPRAGFLWFENSYLPLLG